MTYSPRFRGNSALGSSQGVASGYVNGSGSLLIKATPVSVDTNSKIVSIDVSDEDSVNRFVGLLVSDTNNAANGMVADSGRLEDVTIGYPAGTALWVSKAGFLIDSPPSIGVNGFAAGDFIIFVGVVVENQFDSLKKDIQLMRYVAGRL
jgi:hypothetical protein